MGRPFVEFIGGRKLYLCRNCKLSLSSLNELISKGFRSDTGRATLFRRVVNVKYGELQHRKLMTGPHKVRDVFCKRCNTKLGWTYEFAQPSSQRYKEGCTILSEQAISEVNGFEAEVNESK